MGAVLLFGMRLARERRFRAHARCQATVMASALGTIAEMLGLYIVLVALGVPFVPRGLRFRNHRAWMRMTLLLWWIVIGPGVGTYIAWYVADAATATSAAQAAAPVAPPAPGTAAG